MGGGAVANSGKPWPATAAIMGQFLAAPRLTAAATAPLVVAAAASRGQPWPPPRITHPLWGNPLAGWPGFLRKLVGSCTA